MSELDKLFGLDNLPPPVDRTKVTMSDGTPVSIEKMEVTKSGQRKDYVVLSVEERVKGYVRPLRYAYIHAGLRPSTLKNGTVVKVGESGCGTKTLVSKPIAETYARDPDFYTTTFCCGCMQQRPLNEFIWEGTVEEVGS